MAGYSSTPLSGKLGIKPGLVIALYHTPSHYFELFEDFPKDVSIESDQKKKADLVHYFTTERKQLEKDLPRLKNQVFPNGVVWISWPKKAAKVATDVTEDVVRELALQTGLVDVKVCAIDAVWSGLKLVIPVKDRT